MYINHDDLTALAGCKNPCEYLAEGERKIAALMAEVRNVICIFSHHYCVCVFSLVFCVVFSSFYSDPVCYLPTSLCFHCIVLISLSHVPSYTRVERELSCSSFTKCSARKLFPYDV